MIPFRRPTRFHSSSRHRLPPTATGQRPEGTCGVASRSYRSGGGRSWEEPPSLGSQPVSAPLEPVSGIAKRKLENSEQRLARQNLGFGPRNPENLPPETWHNVTGANLRANCLGSGRGGADKFGEGRDLGAGQADART